MGPEEEEKQLLEEKQCRSKGQKDTQWEMDAGNWAKKFTSCCLVSIKAWQRSSCGAKKAKTKNKIKQNVPSILTPAGSVDFAL